MWFYIYKTRSVGRYELVGQTRGLNDAKSVLDNYDSGYIQLGAHIVVSKNPYTQRS